MPNGTQVTDTVVVEIKANPLADIFGESGQNDGLVKVVVGEIIAQVSYNIICKRPINNLIRVLTFYLFSLG